MRHDVLILGGGPAGAAAGRLLASWGHSVRLLTRPEAPGLPLAVSLPPSTAKLFALLDVQGAIDDARFVRCAGNTVWWGGESRVEPFASGQSGWQVRLDALARVLLAEACARGVEVDRRHLTDEEAAAVPAAMVLDCSGRSGLLARARAGRQYEPGLHTVALVGIWRRDDGWPVPDETHTLIESYADGWAWSVPTGRTRRHVAVMVDPRVTALVRGRTATDVYRMEIAKTKQLAGLVRDAVLEGGPSGWDASMYSSERYAGDGWLAVGDAGSFIDPLSSAGVKKALASGWLAAIVTHTVITRPPMRDVALQFFQTREAEVYAGFRRLTRQFLGEAARNHPHRFWSDRAEGDHALSGHDLLPQTPGGEAAVHEAFERIRTAEAIRLVPAPGVEIARQPAIGGCEIVLEPRLVGPDLPVAGLRYVHDVDLVALVELAPSADQVPDLFDVYCRQAGPVALPDFLRALATVVARGWLVPVR